MNTYLITQTDVLQSYSKNWKRKTLQVVTLLVIVLLAAWYVNVLNFEILANGLPAIGTLAGESFPPDFTNLQNWFSPLLDTLAMSIAGTAIAVIFSVPKFFFIIAQDTQANFK